MRYLFLLLISLLGFVVFMVIFLVFGSTGLKVLFIPIIAGGLPLSIWYTRRHYQLERLRAIAHLQGHAQLDANQFAEMYFPPEHTEIAMRLRNILARHIPLNISGLHPDDKLVDDIRMDALDSLSTEEFLINVEKEFGITIPNSEAAKMVSFKDVFDYLVAHRNDQEDLDRSH